MINLELFCCHLLWFLSLLISQNWKQCMTWLWCVIYFLILHFKEINNYLHFDDSELVIVVKFMWGCDVQFSVDWNSWCKVEQESWKIDRCKAWIMHMLDQSLFFEPTVGVLCIVISLCLYVCLSVCLSALVSQNLMSETQNFTKFSVRVNHGSIFLWRHCSMLCTSGFVDDVMFSPNVLLVGG